MHHLKPGLSILSFILIAFVLQSCKKECGETLDEPIIGVNEPVKEGEELILIARGDNKNTYNWTGPNGFTAVGKRISVGIALGNMSGDYSVEAIQGDCRALSRKTIKVDLRQAECEPEVNVIRLDRFPSITDSVPECGYDTLRKLFTFKAASISGALYVVFPTVDMPGFDRAYGINANVDSLGEGQVFLQVFTGDPPNLKPYDATNGEIFFRKKEGALELTFCEIPCTYLEQSIVISGKLLCLP